MKLRKLLMLGTTTSLAIAALIGNCHTEAADAFEITEQTQDANNSLGNTQAQLYRFLQETRANANQQGKTYISEKSKLLEESGATLDTDDDATAAYIEQCKKISAEREKDSKLSARDELLKKIESNESKDDGIKFVTQEDTEQQQVQLTTAITALTHSLKKASKAVNKQAETVSKEQQLTNAYNELNTPKITEEQHKTDEAPEWTSDDLSEIAQCSATSPNVMDGSGNCNSTTRSFMAYTKITSRTTPQYALVNSEDAYTDTDTGFRMYKGRYCIAIGSGYTQKIGTKIDLVFADGSILKCVLGECKSDKDTDAETHRYCFRDGSVAEFIIDNAYFKTNTKHNPVNTALNQYEKITKVVVINE